MPQLKIREMPEEERPREKLMSRGAAALTDPELIAILLRTGVRGASTAHGGERTHEACANRLGRCRDGPASVGQVSCGSRVRNTVAGPAHDRPVERPLGCGHQRLAHHAAGLPAGSGPAERRRIIVTWHPLGTTYNDV